VTEFKGNLGNYKIIKTEDLTETVWSEFFNEACHNLSGAYEETFHNYILGCAIPDLIAKKSEVTILDVGFGVGVGLKALIDQLKISKKPTTKVFYYSIELDEELLLWSLKSTLPELKLERTVSENLLFYQGNFENLIEIQIFVGDGRLTLPLAFNLNLIKPLDAIFQDAFSPRKNPALWSVEWFAFLKDLSTPSVLLSTYSSSVTIRKSLLAANWVISEARGFANKKSMTKATLTGSTSEELLSQMTRSPTLEIRDK
jgi:tRNA U34 5-methylaminomethyl-2-thiouridine-forming methyltransferase MnmC